MNCIPGPVRYVLIAAAALTMASCGKGNEPSTEESAVPATDATTVAPASSIEAAPGTDATAEQYSVARDACLAKVASVTGVEQSKLSVIEVLWAEAGVGVTIKVPDAEAPWSCLSDEQGNVQGASYTGSEGAL
jgi:hypothetical protein